MLSVSGEAFSIDPEDEEPDEEDGGEEREENVGDKSGESKLLEVGESTDTKSESDPSVFTNMLQKVESQQQWEELLWRIHLSVSTVDMVEGEVVQDRGSIHCLFDQPLSENII